MEKLQAALSAVLTEFKKQLTDRGADHLRVTFRRPVKNAIAASITKSVEDLPPEAYPAAVQEFDSFAATVFQDVSIPLDLASWLLEEVEHRFRARRAQVFLNYCIKNRVHLRDAAEYQLKLAPPRPAAATASSGSPPSASDDSSTDHSASSQHALLRKVKYRAPKQYRFPDQPPSATAAVDGIDGSVPTTATGGSSSSPESTPGSDTSSVKMTAKEQRHQVGILLDSVLDTCGSKELSVREFYDTCAAAGLVRPNKAYKVAESTLSELMQTKFSRLLQRCAEFMPSRRNIAVGKDSVLNLDALRDDRAPVPTKSDPVFDEGFAMCLHLLRRNFHLKKAGASAAVYPGHNICCVLFDPKGKIVGFDFNQCKYDKNLCSHAEKRTAEALTRILAQMTADGKPPSLEGYAIMSSLEPCHMCANFISRMGIKKIGYLMKDPMQQDALDSAAKMLDLEIYRPSNQSWAQRLEETFTKNAAFPDDEITSWLGCQECADLLGELSAEVPLQSDIGKLFYEKYGALYPGVIDLNFSLENAQPFDTESLATLRTTSDILSELELDGMKPLQLNYGYGAEEEEDGEGKMNADGDDDFEII